MKIPKSWALILPLAGASSPCPPFGPVFPAPTNLKASETLHDTFAKLSKDLDTVVESGRSPYGNLPTNQTSFSVGVFDKSSNKPLLSYQHSSTALKNGVVGARAVDEDSVYRIGSLSKLLTAYLLLLEGGPSIWDRRITEFIEELRSAAQACSSAKYPLDCVDWEQVTLGSLASHQSGILRDWSGNYELLNEEAPYDEFGLPQISNESKPTCNALFSATDVLCDRHELLSGIVSEHPIYRPYTTPVYSNAAYALLGLAVENITSRTFRDVLQTNIVEPLKMTRTTYDPPAHLDSAVIPGGLRASSFNISTGLEAPDGGFFSTQADMMRLGQSILSSTLLSANDIRRWMKPETHTSYGPASVGKPWEIWTVSDLTSHVFDLYTKTGDIFSYSTLFVLSPDYQVGFIVLAAGVDQHSVARDVANVVAGRTFPALEEAAREEAHANLAGHYSVLEEGVNSSIFLTTETGRPGLVVKDWVSRHVDFLAVLAKQAGSPLDVRLYPTDLEQDCNGTTCVGFRAVFQGPVTGQTGGVFSQGCITWDTIDLFQYGGVGLDEFLFTLDENGKATSLTPRALRTVLKRSE